MSDINPNEDSDFELFEEAGGSEPAIAPEPASPAPKGNRPFVLAAGITGGVILLGLIGLLGYNLVIGPQQQAARQQRAAQVLAENTATAQAATDVVAALQATENAAKAPLATSTSNPGSCHRSSPGRYQGTNQSIGTGQSHPTCSWCDHWWYLDFTRNDGHHGEPANPIGCCQLCHTPSNFSADHWLCG